MFTDDPGGYGQEHPAVQSAVQLSLVEISALQRGTQRAWTKALRLLTKAKKYIPQAYRSARPFAYNTSKAGQQACSAWMRHQCFKVPANESTQVYGRVIKQGTLAAARMVLGAFLVSRGPFSYLGADTTLIDQGDWADPFFRLHRLNTGAPTADCVEASTHPGVFSRAWAGGRAEVDCTTATATLDFKMLKP